MESLTPSHQQRGQRRRQQQGGTMHGLRAGPRSLLGRHQWLGCRCSHSSGLGHGCACRRSCQAGWRAAGQGHGGALSGVWVGRRGADVRKGCRHLGIATHAGNGRALRHVWHGCMARQGEGWGGMCVGGCLGLMGCAAGWQGMRCEARAGMPCRRRLRPKPLHTTRAAQRPALRTPALMRQDGQRPGRFGAVGKGGDRAGALITAIHVVGGAQGADGLPSLHGAGSAGHRAGRGALRDGGASGTQRHPGLAALHLRGRCSVSSGESKGVHTVMASRQSRLLLQAGALKAGQKAGALRSPTLPTPAGKALITRGMSAAHTVPTRADAAQNLPAAKQPCRGGGGRSGAAVRRMDEEAAAAGQGRSPEHLPYQPARTAPGSACAVSRPAYRAWTHTAWPGQPPNLRCWCWWVQACVRVCAGGLQQQQALSRSRPSAAAAAPASGGCAASLQPA